jgi:hypothetical protein
MAGLLRSAVRRGFASGGVLGQSRAFNTRASVLLADTQFHYQDLYEPSAPKDVPWRKITGDHVSVVEAAGRTVLKVEPEAIRLLAQEAMTDIAHLLRPGHLAQLSNILKDPEASDNDRFVAVSILLILPVWAIMLTSYFVYSSSSLRTPTSRRGWSSPDARTQAPPSSVAIAVNSCGPTATTRR